MQTAAETTTDNPPPPFTRADLRRAALEELVSEASVYRELAVAGSVRGLAGIRARRVVEKLRRRGAAA
jgi:hypothetical protein